MVAISDRKRIRPEKAAIEREVASRLEQSEFVLLVNHLGLTVEQVSDFRRKLRETQSYFHVTPNAVLSRVTGALSWESMPEALAGPTAMIFGAGQITDVSKALRDFSRESKRAAVKGGWLNGKALSAADIVALADIPSREILYGMLAGTLAAPMSKLAGVFRQKASSLLYVLKAVEKKKAES